MKALVKAEPAEGLSLQDVPVPEIGINDVLIKILKTSICGTDVHIWNWDDWAQETIPVPMVTGHEFVARVEQVGSNVHDFHLGDLVSGEGHIVCGHCRNCLAGVICVPIPAAWVSTETVPSPSFYRSRWPTSGLAIRISRSKSSAVSTLWAMPRIQSARSM